MTDTAKSKLTIVWTDKTSGVASPARSRYTVSYRCHVRCAPSQPMLSRPNTRLRHLELVRSRIVARSGSKPTNQNAAEIRKYVPIANASQASGDRKLIHSGPRLFG